MLTVPFPLVPVVVGAVVVLLALAFWLIRRHNNVYRRLDRVLHKISTSELRDIVIPDGVDGHIHIDRLLLTERGALVVDFKDVGGTVFAGERLDEWAALDERGRHPFRNPLRQMQHRIMAVRALSPRLPVDGRIIFSDTSEFPKGRPDKVCLLRELAAEPRAANVRDYYEAWAELTQRVQAADATEPAAST